MCQSNVMGLLIIIYILPSCRDTRNVTVSLSPNQSSCLAQSIFAGAGYAAKIGNVVMTIVAIMIDCEVSVMFTIPASAASTGIDT